MFFSHLYSQKSKEIIPVSGLVLSVHDHKPLAGVVVLFKGKVVATTDKQGFFASDISASYNNEPFSLFFKKDAFKSFKQSENINPALLNKGFNFIIGLQHSDIPTGRAFSDTKLGILSYTKTQDRLQEVLEKEYFNTAIDIFRKENNTVLFNFSKEFYILSESSWIKPTSLDDTLVINGHKKGKVKDIDYLIKRNQIKVMTPDTLMNNGIRIVTY